MNFPIRIITIFVTLLLINSAYPKTAGEYLPSDAQLDAGIPAPETVVGWEVGDWHVSHDKLTQYMQA